MYINSFSFPSYEIESDFMDKIDRNKIPGYYSSNVYPFRTISPKLHHLHFAPLTILYGSNGSGKSTALNIMANVLNIKHNSSYNTTYWMEKYVNLCSYETDEEHGKWIYEKSGKRMVLDDQATTSIITSDDVFKYMLDGRAANVKKLAKSAEIEAEMLNVKHGSYVECAPKHLNMETGEGLKEFFRYHSMRRKTVSQYLSATIGDLEASFSNGENGLKYLIENMGNKGLYLLDEPENSMSSEFQHLLAGFIGNMVLEGDSQFIIATHSPFLLSMPGAKIYDLDCEIAKVKKWWELDNMQKLYELFARDKDKFQKTAGNPGL